MGTDISAMQLEVRCWSFTLIFPFGTQGNSGNFRNLPYFYMFCNICGDLAEVPFTDNKTLFSLGTMDVVTTSATAKKETGIDIYLHKYSY